MTPTLVSPASMDKELAALVDQLTQLLQARDHHAVAAFLIAEPRHEAELRQLLPALQALADLQRENEPSYVATNGVATGKETHEGTLGDFRLIRELGRGGMGIVYEAEQLSLKRRVALKVLPFASTLDPRQLQRFKNEAQAAACLHHTNIVPVYSTGCERGVHFYAMQFIEGQTLAQVIEQLRNPDGLVAADEKTTAYVRGEQPKETVAARRDTTAARSKSAKRKFPDDHFHSIAEIGIQAAEALDHAHQVGIVHRDIKPANLMLDQSPIANPKSPIHIWITDFGLAQFSSDTKLTLTGDLLGTLRYMSPEQALAQRVVIDHRTDVYSLGATLYELLTLEPVFDGKDRQELLRQIAWEEPRALRKICPAIPVELEIIVMKALEKDPKQRYGTAKELADELRRYVLQEPIRSRKPSFLMHGIKLYRRHSLVIRPSTFVLTPRVPALQRMIAVPPGAYS